LGEFYLNNEVTGGNAHISMIYINKCDTMNTVVNCKDLKIIHKVSEQHTWKHNVKELQKIITLGTEHVIRKVLI